MVHDVVRGNDFIKQNIIIVSQERFNGEDIFYITEFEGTLKEATDLQEMNYT